VLHARLYLITITADPLALGGCITYIENEVPAAESQPGSLGMSLLGQPEVRCLVLESF
jgi:hypothetical protein